mmetsp:Transcript_8895/g.32819  ORF Transcript_8895/g.32819 Transcript_8895/m.32819 type:complete len:211 (-) Transcript_8895:619-1251(-)
MSKRSNSLVVVHTSHSNGCKQMICHDRHKYGGTCHRPWILSYLQHYRDKSSSLPPNDLSSSRSLSSTLERNDDESSSSVSPSSVSESSSSSALVPAPPSPYSSLFSSICSPIVVDERFRVGDGALEVGECKMDTVCSCLSNGFLPSCNPFPDKISEPADGTLLPAPDEVIESLSYFLCRRCDSAVVDETASPEEYPECTPLKKSNFFKSS